MTLPANKTLTLSPAQYSAKAFLEKGLGVSSILALGGETGRGKTTILAELGSELNARSIDLSEILDKTSLSHPLALEESVFAVLAQALAGADIVIVDNFDIVIQTVSHHGGYPRVGWLDAACVALCDRAAKAGKKLVFAHAGMLPAPIHQRAFKAGIERFRAEDYRVIAANYLGSIAQALTFEKIFRFAPKLNAYQLRAACEWLLRYEPEIDTEKFIEYLRSQRLTSNVDLGEVQDVTLADLIGVDDVIRSLEIHIALPLENDQLANELSLKPKRGVLLYGPPGTGKTSVGRALAHRLKGKFFLIDGTFIAGTGDFYSRVHQVFEAAKENAPAVIFIDDADAIFEGGEEQGLYRYLLTMMDGLESESAGRVCVMMTAMEVGHLPLALVRSGRVELWLEMKLPDEAARRTIITRQLAQASVFSGCDFEAVLAATKEFTGADLKRVVADAKSLFAFDRATQAQQQETSAYLMSAVAGVALNKQRYAEAESGARKRTGPIPHPAMQLFSALPFSGGAVFNSDWQSSE